MSKSQVTIFAVGCAVAFMGCPCTIPPEHNGAVVLPGNVRLDLVYIQPGTFMMGRYDGEFDSNSDEGPQHEVRISRGFWMGKYEVTKAQWVAVMGTTPWEGKNNVLDDENSPATHVSWNDAQEFIIRLNSLTGETYRLPSEAEWEFACRAGTSTRFYWGDDVTEKVGNAYAWWWYTTNDQTGPNERYAHRVGNKLSNAWGLYDMNGNVAEWCDDWYLEDYYDQSPATDPTGPDTTVYRVFRGGSWDEDEITCRSASRSFLDASGTSLPDIGFRIVK